MWTIGPDRFTGAVAWRVCLVLCRGDYYRASARYRRWLRGAIRTPTVAELIDLVTA